MTAYIDTSVLVAYYCPEPRSKAAQQAIQTASEAVISPLVEIELYSALAIKARAKELDAESARSILSLFNQHLAGGCFRIVPIEAPEYALARDWLARFTSPLRAADSLHLAAASTNGLTLLTSDSALAKSAKRFGVKFNLLP